MCHQLFKLNFLVCTLAEWLTCQTSNPTVSSSNPANSVLSQFIWAIDVFLCFLRLIFAPVIIKAANTTDLAGKKVDHTLFIILLLTTMCMPNFSYHCHLQNVKFRLILWNLSIIALFISIHLFHIEIPNFGTPTMKFRTSFMTYLVLKFLRTFFMSYD